MLSEKSIIKGRALLETEQAVKFVKDTFSQKLTQKLNIIPISSPLVVLESSGLNDDLTGIERPVTFPIKALNDQKAVVVHSLAKWKRVRLKELEIEVGEGILTDMKALRPDEDYSPLHSIYVDQWDWEKRILPEQRTLAYLKETVQQIYEALVETEREVSNKYAKLTNSLPNEITFISAEELLQKYPDKKSKDREHAIAQEKGAVFIYGIGSDLSHGQPHDGRAADYDDWSHPNEEGSIGLNGDIIVWNPVLKCAFELSSMGIRVNKESLLRQLEIKDCMFKTELTYHKLLLNDMLTDAIGGGIGQSRVCMFMLDKQHIGEVQVSIWSEQKRENLEAEGITLL